MVLAKTKAVFPQHAESKLARHIAVGSSTRLLDRVLDGQRAHRGSSQPPEEKLSEVLEAVRALALPWL